MQFRRFILYLESTRLGDLLSSGGSGSELPRHLRDGGGGGAGVSRGVSGGELGIPHCRGAFPREAQIIFSNILVQFFAAINVM